MKQLYTLLLSLNNNVLLIIDKHLAKIATNQLTEGINMWSAIIAITALFFISSMTYMSYKLGLSRTDDAKQAAIIGFLLSLIPPFVVVYLTVLLLKEDAGTV